MKRHGNGLGIAYATIAFAACATVGLCADEESGPKLRPLPKSMIIAELGDGLSLLEKQSVEAVSVDSQGAYLAALVRDGILIWDLRQRKVLSTIPAENCLSFAFLPGAKEIVVCDMNGNLRKFDVRSAKVVREWPRKGAVEGSVDGYTLMMGAEAKVIGVIGRECRIVSERAETRALGVDVTGTPGDRERFGKVLPGEKEFVVVGPRRCEVFASETLKVVSSFPVPEKMVLRFDQQISWHPDKRHIAMGCSLGRIVIVDRETGKVKVDVEPFLGGTTAVAFFDRGAKLVAIGDDRVDDCKIYVWNTKTGEAVGWASFGKLEPVAMALSPDEKTLFVATTRGVHGYDMNAISISANKAK